MVNRKLSRDQKRKQKLAHRAPMRPSQRMGGAGYLTARYVKAVMRTEMGIHELDVLLHGELTDREVAASLRGLIRELAAAGDRRIEEDEDAAGTITVSGSDAMILWNIKRNWRDLFASEERHSNEDLQGVVGVVLDSLSKWSRSGRGPRAYLSYIGEFLAKLGVQVRAASPEELEELGLVNDEDEP